MSQIEKYLIKNQSVTLYAFHLRTELAKELTEDSSLLWENLAKLGERLSAPPLQGLLSELICYKNGQYDPNEEEGKKTAWLELTQPRELTFCGQNQMGFVFSGSIYPVRIHDTYAADLTFFCKDREMQVSQLNRLNPDACLMPSRIQASLGQTLLLYAEPTDREFDSRLIADECLKGLLQDSNETLPLFIKEGKLFGSPIFEYEDYTYDPLQRRHILVWLCEHSQTAELAQIVSNSLMNLLCCRNKIFYAFHQSRESDESARQLYRKLEENIEQFEIKAEQPERLKLMENLLAEMPPDEMRYARSLRNMSDHRTTIKANISNYETSLEEIRKLRLPDDDLTFFDKFLTDARQFLSQIRTDMNFLAPGQRLSQQMVAGIRGIVEIDTLKQMKENEESGSKLQERLEILVAVIVGILNGAMLSATVHSELPKIFSITDPLFFHLIFSGLPTGLVILLIVLIVQHLWKK
ncbi:MAG: hypothetical protein BWK80_52465 [Desulfobacteraceae bacterium IS3]|nr:MAG: hypothetical protein BWK80_52465 [Desulfobacteraceae bacterium IS3]